jgi:putative membrane protein
MSHDLSQKMSRVKSCRATIKFGRFARCPDLSLGSREMTVKYGKSHNRTCNIDNFCNVLLDSSPMLEKETLEPTLDPRVIYAAERTMLAWIRTGLAMMGFGFVVARFSLLLKELIHATTPSFLDTPGTSLWIGTLLVVLGVIVNVAAGIKYGREIDSLKKGDSIACSKWTLGRIISIVLALLGLVMTASLIRLGF